MGIKKGVGPLGWYVSSCFFHLPPTFSGTFSGTTWSHQNPKAFPRPSQCLGPRLISQFAEVQALRHSFQETFHLRPPLSFFRGVPLTIETCYALAAEASLESPTLEVMPKNIISIEILGFQYISIICQPGSQDLDNQISFCHSLTPKILSGSFA